MSTDANSRERHPKIGEVVIYHGHSPAEHAKQAALVTFVYTDSGPRSEVDLTVFPPGKAPEGSGHNRVAFSERDEPRTWGWRPE
jgi:hypothetical protein